MSSNEQELMNNDHTLLDESNASLLVGANYTPTSNHSSGKYSSKYFEDIDKSHCVAMDIENIGRKEYFLLRKSWSNWLLRFIGGLLIFNAAITFSVLIMSCVGKASFSDFRTIVEMVLMASFFEIAGMAYIAVRFLFPTRNDEKRLPHTAASTSGKNPI